MRNFKRTSFVTIFIVSFSGSVDTIMFYKTGNHLPQHFWFSGSFRYLKLIFRRLMAEERKSAFKHPHRCRRNRTSTPVPDLLSPYLPGPELFISPPMSTIQTRPIYSTARSDSSLSIASPIIIGYSPSVNPMVSFD